MRGLDNCTEYHYTTVTMYTVNDLDMNVNSYKFTVKGPKAMFELTPPKYPLPLFPAPPCFSIP